MPLLTKTFLHELGIELSDSDYLSLEEHFESTLHDRVIDEIVLELSPEQAEQLATMKDADDETLQQWLQTNVPSLAEIVSDEVDILMGELAENSSTIAADS